MIIKTCFISLLIGICFSAHSQEKYVIKINDSTVYEHEVIFKSNDTINGKVIAVYASDTTIIAYQGGYYQGYKNGNWKYYYPNGKIMEWSIYQKDLRNGDYTKYNIDGEVVVKGKYLNDKKNGFWAYRSHKLYGKFKNDEKNGKWKWMIDDYRYYTYKFSKGKLLSVSPKGNAPEFPEYILNE